MTQQPEKHSSMPITEESQVESASRSGGSQESSQNEHPGKAPMNGGEIQEDLQLLQEKYLRLAAEFENYKRRAQRDQSDAIRFGNESLLKNLLPVIDNLERAIQCAKDAGTKGPLLEGVELTHKQFLETVSKVGVRQISSKGNSFDPAVHQAVVQVDSDNTAPNTVVDEFQKGYFLHDRVLRPAMVSVAKEKTDMREPFTTDESDGEGGIQV
jgi:molecular chaperone GrpE